MHELRTQLTPWQYLELLQEMTAQGYELWALNDGGDIKALAGIAFRTNLYFGRYLWVFDLVTKSSERSVGHGASLLSYIEELAVQRGCDVVALSSGLERIDAHRFYEAKMGYEKVSFVFKKELRD
ncbi:MAG: GNAT family N-acetyltransferase [Actinomycetota bacterium]